MSKKILNILSFLFMLFILTACENDNKSSNGGESLTPSIYHKVVIKSSGGEGDVIAKELDVLSGEKVKLQTRVDNNYSFKNWTNDGVIISFNNPSEIVVTKDMEIVANFANDNTPKEFVDMGLSVKWATFNIGAGAPHEFGDYFAWGETETKLTSGYYWDFYKYCGGTHNLIQKYNTTADFGFVDNKCYLDVIDDVARAQWGEPWRMPAKQEIEELIEECNWSWTTFEGVEGYKVTSRNGNFIFLPVTGYIRGLSHITIGGGIYISLSLNQTLPYEAYALKFTQHSKEINSISRSFGCMVRSVCN